MATYKCKNFGSCTRADTGQELVLAAGSDDKCPECGFTLVTGDSNSSDNSGAVGKTKPKPKMVIAAAGVLVVALIGLSYFFWDGSKQVVSIRPDPTPQPPAVATNVVATTAASVPVAPASAALAPVERPAQMLADEQSARKTCDEATKAKVANAGKICNRAAAVTLMNSGVLSAIGGRLDAAEKDYLAAIEKDPDLAPLYFNLAVLKARQNKGSEAVDNLTLASSKGFKQFSAIKSEPALQKLKSDPAIGPKIEAFETK